MTFRNRAAAGLALADALAPVLARPFVVGAIPPGGVTVAVPCASAQAARQFERAADRFVSLVVDAEFQAVGQYYLDFSPVADDEVLAMLARAAPASPA